MVLNTLESLVLRNVNVVNGGLTVEPLRLAPGYQPDSQTPEVPISKRHPSQGVRPVAMQLAGRPVDAMRDGVTDAVFGAGRSRRHAGVRSRRSGVSLLPAAACLCRIPPADHKATGSDGNSGRLTTTRNLSFTNERLSTVAVAWRKPATRTPPASTRGKGGR
jgi:hypothetical protein